MGVQVHIDNDSSPFILRGKANYDLLTLEQDAGRSTVLSKFTALAKKILAAGTPVVGGSNVGDGTLTLFALVKDAAGSLPLIGNYVLECIEAITNGGRFKLTDPDGVIIENNLLMTAGAGLATEFIVQGMRFTLTDGAADFAVADQFTLPISAVGKYVPLDPAGVGGVDKFAGIYLGDDVASTTLIAGDVTGRPILLSEATVDDEKLVFENSVTLDTVLPSGKTVQEEMESREIYPRTRINMDTGNTVT